MVMCSGVCVGAEAGVVSAAFGGMMTSTVLVGAGVSAGLAGSTTSTILVVVGGSAALAGVVTTSVVLVGAAVGAAVVAGALLTTTSLPVGVVKVRVIWERQ